MLPDAGGRAEHQWKFHHPHRGGAAALHSPRHAYARVTSGGPLRAGWMQKKSRTDKPWGRAHHSRRYFVSRGFVVSYFERPDPKAREGGERLCGVINLREVCPLPVAVCGRRPSPECHAR